MGRICLPLISLLLGSLLSFSVAASLESPQYSVLASTSEFEIRAYEETVWAVAQVDDISFQRATLLGFHRLFSYIEGANLNWSRIAMTAPVVTGIVPSAGPFCSSAFAVRLYLPDKFQAAPPTPLPELDLVFERWERHTVAVRTFGGYAIDSNVVQEAEKLAISLSKAEITKNATYPVGGRDSYAIAQYSSPFQIFNRVNEIWVDISIPGYDTAAEENVKLQMPVNGN